MGRVFTMVQQTAMMLQKIGQYEERKQIVYSVVGRINTGLTGLSHYELLEIQDYCKRFATSHQIELYTPKKQEDSFSKESEEKMKRKIIYYAHQMSWQTPDKKADMKRINNWCLSKGQFKKALNAHTGAELAALVSQFEQVYKSFLKGVYGK